MAKKAKLKGFKQAINRILFLEDRISIAGIRIAREGARIGHWIQQNIVPVDTGNLKRHLRIIEERGGKRQRIGVSMVFYAQYVEFGTKRMMAQPYIRPAIIFILVAIRRASREELRKL